MATRWYNIKISTNFIPGVGARYYFIVGIKATKANIRTAIVASRAAKSGDWKKVDSPMAPIICMGSMIATKGTKGYLNIEILKWAYWIYLSFLSLFLSLLTWP